MFFDIGPLELVTLIVLAVLVFGPEKLPKVIQDVASFIRKVRNFSDSARDDIRSELGPEFKDFDFEDLNPKTFARKHLLDGNDDLGLKEIRDGFDLRAELNEVSDAVNDTGRAGTVPGAGEGKKTSLTKGSGSTGQSGSASRVQLSKEDPAPFDADAT